ncbi:ROK family transcriptional regulator [Jiangella alba]|uniref:Sugar kinase of the NBD/HSP70 family, may contain an N-terminal HTH domain n=2 Tax=Jiangella alba TaxID=561176 RepID=A0A1H5PCJ2_9ACTN|nr:ROK family transcriptional regulator [Jiangella alba]SEF11430.1 Sugar kinase of the NBD/HSP70 family, may contain an N-terminal HTH domain [Jiangella alba]
MTTHTVAVDTQIMRGINAAAVLTVLRDASPLGVSTIAKRTGLSRQAVTRAIAGLEQLGLAEFRAPDPQATRAGRPAQSVVFRGDAAVVVGVAIAPDVVTVATADLAGELLDRRDLPLTEPSSVRDQVGAGIRAALDELSVPRERVWAASVAVPGIVDVATGTVVLSSSMAHLHGDGLRSAVAELLDCTVYVDNDVKLATEGEQWRGTPHETSSLVLVEWGERVGAGLMLNGTLYRGASNDSGDIGFLRLEPASRPNEADRADVLGPFERTVGGAALTQLAMDAAGRHGDHEWLATLASAPADTRLDLVIAAVRDGRAPAVEAMRTVAARFARGIAAVRALLDPELVIIGGPMARCGEELLVTLRAELEGETLNQPSIELSTLGGDAVVQGALHHALAIVEAERLAPSALSE